MKVYLIKDALAAANYLLCDEAQSVINEELMENYQEVIKKLEEAMLEIEKIELVEKI